MDSQNPPELEAPFLESGEEKEAKVVDPGMQDLQTNIFWRGDISATHMLLAR